MAPLDWLRVVIVTLKARYKCVSRVYGAPSSLTPGILQKQELFAKVLDVMNMVDDQH